MSATRIPPIQCLLTFEALARLRSVTQAAEELCVTPSAVSHRVKQLEQILGTKLRIPRDGGHDSMLMADSVPASSRTPFHGDSGQHSNVKADTPAMS